MKKINILKICNFLVFILSICLFIWHSYSMIIGRLPWFDEAHAWLIAKNNNFMQILSLMKYEGHLILWYLILMPFAKLNITYPYSMQFINWFFMFLSLILFWKYAKINVLAKTLLTLSVPVQMYAIIARCYSLTILVLTLLCVIYKNRLKNPIIYSLLLCILANTSLMGLLGAFSLGIIFLYDLYNEHKNYKLQIKTLIWIFLLFISCSALVLYQLLNFSVPSYAHNGNYTSIINVYNYYTSGNLFIALIWLIFLLYSYVYFLKNHKILLFLVLTEIPLILLFSRIYGGEAWHWIFLFIYILIAYFIKDSENEYIPTKHYELILTVIICLLLFIPKYYDYFAGKNYFFVETLKTNPGVFNKDTKFVLYPKMTYANDVVPYIYKYLGKDVKIYSITGDTLYSYNFIKEIYGANKFSTKNLSNLLEKGEIMYMLLHSGDLNHLDVDKVDFIKNNLKLEFFKTYDYIIIYKLTKL